MIFFRKTIRYFVQETRGGVAVIMAIALPVMIGISSLAVEYGAGLLIRAQDQRIVDAAAMAAAVAYSKSPGDAQQKLQASTNAAQHVVALNGNNPEQMVLTPVNATDLEVKITENTVLRLSRVISDKENLTITVSAVARIGEKSPGIACLLALSTSSTAFSAGGATSIDLAGCTIGSNGGLDVSTTTASCASPVEGSQGGCVERYLSPSFPDPHSISWSEALALCAHYGRTLTSSPQNGNLTLAAGPHCINSNLSVGNNATLNGSAGVVLFFGPQGGINTTGGTYNLTAMETLDLSLLPGRSGQNLERVAMYGPQSGFRTRGNPVFNFTNLGCFGVVMQTIDMGGSGVVLGRCEEDVSGNAGLPFDKRARLIQ